MPDYKEMYLKLFRATEKAINELINAQQECEELYLNGGTGIKGFAVCTGGTKGSLV